MLVLQISRDHASLLRHWSLLILPELNRIVLLESTAHPKHLRVESGDEND